MFEHSSLPVLLELRCRVDFTVLTQYRAHSVHIVTMWGLRNFEMARIHPKRTFRSGQLRSIPVHNFDAQSLR